MCNFWIRRHHRSDGRADHVSEVDCCDLGDHRHGGACAGPRKKTADVLTEKMRGLEKKLGPEYLSLMYGLQTIDPESDGGVEIEALLRPLDRSCAQE